MRRGVRIGVVGGGIASLVGCASQPVNTAQLPQQTLHNNVLQAHDSLLSRQSYAYDYRMNLQKKPVYLTTNLAKTPTRD